MNLYNHFVFSLLFCISSTLSAQTKYGIKHMYAYCRELIPGIIAVDKNGTPLETHPDTINTVYMESGGQPIRWNLAWKNGKTFSITMSQVTEIPLVVGRTKEGDENIILIPAKGNQLWRIDLLPTEKNTDPPKKIKPGEFLLRGKSGKQVIFQKIERLVMLHSIPSA